MPRQMGHLWWAARRCPDLSQLRAIDNALRTFDLDEFGRAANQLMDAPIEPAISQDRLMSIDLSRNDELVTYPAGRDCSVERSRILFLQTAVRSGFEWSEVVRKTRDVFGKTLNEPFEPVVMQSEMPSFQPPAYDIARQTVEAWAQAADEAWSIFRMRRPARSRNGAIA